MLAAPIWRDFMAEAFKGRPVLQFPPASGPHMSFPGPETGRGESVIGGGGGGEKRAGPRVNPAPVAIHGGVDKKLGGLY